MARKKGIFDKDELLKKSREAMLAAVKIYNNPNISFKAESFIILAIISWTYLMHDYYRLKNIDCIYYKNIGKRKVIDKTKHGALGICHTLILFF